MPSDKRATCVHIASLPGSAQLLILQLVCDSCGPDTPGTCWLARVCKHWRILACSVKRLRVLFQGGIHSNQLPESQQQQEQQQQRTVDFCAWLRRCAHQVVALAVTGEAAREALVVLAEVASSSSKAAAAAAGGGGGGAGVTGQGLPLQRLMLTGTELLHPGEHKAALNRLLRALPHLQHLRLSQFGAAAFDNDGDANAAAVAALAPLQSSTSLTCLELHGTLESTQVQQQLLDSLTSGVRSLVWAFPSYGAPQQLSFDHLNRLTTLTLQEVAQVDWGSQPQEYSLPLRHLREVALYGILMSDASLLACKEQLVGLRAKRMHRVLSKLSNLQLLDVSGCDAGDAKELLQQAPQVGHLQVSLTTDPSSSTVWDSPCVLQHYKGLTGLRVLDLFVDGRQAAPMALRSLKQLQQLTLNIGGMDVSHVASWAYAVAGLVNLELLSIPAVLTACSDPWLTGLTRLAVLEVDCRLAFDGGLPQLRAAAGHICQVVMPNTCSPCHSTMVGSSSGPSYDTGGSGRSSSSSSSSVGAGVQRQSARVMVVCFDDSLICAGPAAAQLHQAVVADVAEAVMPPGVHLVRGSLYQLRLGRLGLLWPTPVKSRLQQLWPELQC
jgi:hypothetical protein